MKDYGKLPDSKWVTEKNKSGKAVRSSRTGKPVRYPMIPRGDRGNLPRSVKVVSSTQTLRTRDGTPLEKETVEFQKRGTPYLRGFDSIAQASVMAKQGYKGWSVGLQYKDGSRETIPVAAKTSQGALRAARQKMTQSMSHVKEVVIVDPTLSEVLHKMETSEGKLENMPRIATAITPVVKDPIFAPHREIELSKTAQAEMGIKDKDIGVASTNKPPAFPPNPILAEEEEE